MSDNALLRQMINNLPALMARVRNLEVRENAAGYIIEYHVPALSDAAGASGATVTAPDANTLGGWQLNNVNENVFYIAHIHDTWDGKSDIRFTVTWEQNAASVNPGDHVDLQCIFRYKGDQQAAIRTQTVQIATTIDAAAQFTQWTTEFPLDFDIGGGNNLAAEDTISVELNLETVKSDVDDVIINLAMFEYNSNTPAERQ